MAIRLLRTEDIRLEMFMGDKFPEYAILSHTWEEEELSFQESHAVESDHKHPATKKPGYRKVVDTCRKAKEDGIAYVWIDTCCIDKTSSSELTEAINSMYKWYERAKVCYVLLTDFDASVDELETAFPKCKWFTRGWCLQELLAPSDLHFFDKQWSYIGSKTALKFLISKITQIPEMILVNGNLIKYFPVAQRMAWAANRETTRTEDTAYSLLGIFDVNMPMLYGEGPRAFLRLQEEIIFRANDRSIFAFLREPSHRVAESVPGMPDNSSLFATSPKDFLGCADLENSTPLIRQSEAFALTNKGLYFRRVKLLVEPRRGLFSLPLNYPSPEAKILLRKVGPGLFSKVGNTTFANNQDQAEDLESNYPILEEEVYIISTATPSVHFQLYSADRYSIHVRSQTHNISRAVQAIQRAPSSERWDASRMVFITFGERSVRAHWKVFPHLARKINGSESDAGITSGYQTTFYVVAGFDRGEKLGAQQAWVRMYSLKEWRSLENRFGIITNLDDVAGHQDAASTNCRMEMPYMAVAAAVQLRIEGKFPRFELTLDLDTDFRATNIV